MSQQRATPSAVNKFAVALLSHAGLTAAHLNRAKTTYRKPTWSNPSRGAAKNLSYLEKRGLVKGKEEQKP